MTNFNGIKMTTAMKKRVQQELDYYKSAVFSSNRPVYEALAKLKNISVEEAERMVTTRLNGNQIRYDGSSWNTHLTKCPTCGKMPVDDCDACIGRLGGVVAACCGHGKEDGYIKFDNGITIRGRFTIERDAE